MPMTLKEFIEETFNESELLTLCDNDEKLQKVRIEFSDLTPFGEKVRILIAFSKRRGCYSILCIKIKEKKEDQWVQHKMSENDQEAARSRVSDSLKEAGDFFKEQKSVLIDETKGRGAGKASRKKHPIAKGGAEMQKWFAEELNTDEQVFLLTAALFSGLEKREFMQIYDVINKDLQLPKKAEKDGKK